MACDELREIPIDFAEISTLKSIKLLECLPSAMESAKKIQDEQHDFGNNDMVVIEQYTLQAEDNNAWTYEIVPHCDLVQDITTKIMSFLQQGPKAVCILSANGAVTTVTLCQPSTSGGTVTYEGQFEILSLSGSYLLSNSSGPQGLRTGSLSIRLASPDGRVIGGGVGGVVIAASPVQIMLDGELCMYVFTGSKAKSKSPLKIKTQRMQCLIDRAKKTAKASVATAKKLIAILMTSQDSKGTTEVIFGTRRVDSRLGFSLEVWQLIELDSALFGLFSRTKTDITTKIMSANGAVTTVTLCQPSTSGGTVTYEGQFEILSLSGSYLLSNSSGPQGLRTGSLSICLASPDGRVIGGGVGGVVIAASPVQVILGSFICVGSKAAKSKPPVSIEGAAAHLNRQSFDNSVTPSDMQQNQNLNWPLQ
nr:AT-hook motif nuclear-localized protein 9-like isoform X2 [Ipomoea trifida]